MIPKPTEPGWYWFKSEGWDSPEPVRIDWTGFVEEPGNRDLTIVQSMNRGLNMLRVDVAIGDWIAKIDVPPL